MAKVFPDLDNIKRLKVRPTAGEQYLIQYLLERLSDDYEIYYQPFLNGDRPDIVLMRPDHGVVIIEVKDWNLNSYHINERNKWYVAGAHEQRISSPFQQAFRYKKNMFDLHIYGLAEKKLINGAFFGVIDVFVYFHHADRQSIHALFAPVLAHYKDLKRQINASFRRQEIGYKSYQKKLDYFDKKCGKINRDKNLALHRDNLHKLQGTLTIPNPIFTSEIYQEFVRHLQPPYHVKSQGVHIELSKKQSRLVSSGKLALTESMREKHKANDFILQKIKGVAGSGKTTILAHRAVNAHKRHGGHVLILCYNITLKNYIHDQLNKVREGFSWSAFHISNYHHFIAGQLIKTGFVYDVSRLDESSYPSRAEYIKGRNAYFDEIYSDEKRLAELFAPFREENYQQYETILIDEIQDYKLQWINIIKDNFLMPAGEMVLFGDEAQNIYQRDINQKHTDSIQGFGRWEKLTISFRANDHLAYLARDFQQRYLLAKYDLDLMVAPETIPLVFSDAPIMYHVVDNWENINHIYQHIETYLKQRVIHPNDVTIIASSIHLLQKLDSMYRNNKDDKSTHTTFENAELSNSLQYSDIQTVRKSKKNAFWQNSGQIKLTTIQSYKGIEAPTVIYLAMADDDVEVFYTGLTRAKDNLLLFIEKSSPYLDFLAQSPTNLVSKIE